MGNPAITTVIPTFRRPRLLKRAIESVLAQAVQNLTVRVYDNASGDETESVVAEYVRRDNRVFYHRNSENIGPINNFVQGIAAVTTELYSILSDDDFLLPEFYRGALTAFERYPEAGFVCARTILVNLVTRKWHFRNIDWLPGFYEPSIDSSSRMCRSHFTGTGVVFRTNVRESIGGLEKSGDDCLHLTMAAACFPFVVLDSYGAVFTFYEQSYSASTGLRGGDSAWIYEALLSTLDNVMKLGLPPERKVHLLTLVFKSYGVSFEFRKLDRFVVGGDTQAERVPSLTSIPGVFAKICERAPRALHPVLRYFARSMTRGARIGPRKSRGGLVTLPEEVYRLILNEKTDVAQFLALARAASPQESHRLSGSSKRA